MKTIHMNSNAKTCDVDSSEEESKMETKKNFNFATNAQLIYALSCMFSCSHFNTIASLLKLSIEFLLHFTFYYLKFCMESWTLKKTSVIIFLHIHHKHTNFPGRYHITSCGIFKEVKIPHTAENLIEHIIKLHHILLQCPAGLSVTNIS